MKSRQSADFLCRKWGRIQLFFTSFPLSLCGYQWVSGGVLVSVNVMGRCFLWQVCPLLIRPHPSTRPPQRGELGHWSNLCPGWTSMKQSQNWSTPCPSTWTIWMINHSLLSYFKQDDSLIQIWMSVSANTINNMGTWAKISYLGIIWRMFKWFFIILSGILDQIKFAISAEIHIHMHHLIITCHILLAMVYCHED